MVCAAGAAADSLVFTKGGDVWVAEPDGTAARQLTTGGGFTSPSQADDGTVMALRGDQLARIDRGGAAPPSLLNTIFTGKPPSVSAFGPFDPVISPDGGKVAYWLGVISSYHDHGSGYDVILGTGDHTVLQDARTGAHLGFTKFYGEPSWLADSTRVLAGDDLNALTANVVVATAGQEQSAQWFEDDVLQQQGDQYANPVGDAELTRDGTKLAVLQGGTHVGNGGSVHGKGNRIVISKVAGLDQPPQPCRLIVDAVGGEFGEAAWSPAGDQLAWSEGDGIWTTTVGPDCEVAPKLAIPGGRSPHWGPADPGGGAAPAPPAQQAQGAPSQTPPPATAKLAAAGAISRRALARRGLAATVTCSTPCTIRASLRRKGKVLGRARARGAGKVVARVKARATPGRATLRVDVQQVNGGPLVLTKSIRVR